MLIKKSKYLSLLLRHRPDSANLVLDKEGWCTVESLITNANFTKKELEEIVRTDEKGRYKFSDDGQSIRANQGHSADVKLTFTKAIPPIKLYHGANSQSLDSILKSGLLPMKRHHVHLSKDVATAVSVGKRNKSFVLLEVDAKRAVSDGVQFFISDNGVWLADQILPKYISILKS